MFSQRVEKQLTKTELDIDKTNFVEKKKIEIKEGKIQQIENNDKIDRLLNLENANKLFSNTKFLENFELIEPLKAGSAGAVYTVKSKNMKNREKIYACKIMPISAKDKKSKSFINKHKEALMHSKFHYKNIPELNGCFPIGEDYSGMIMEYNRYGDLDTFKKKVIKRACLSETLLCYIAGGVLDALSYIHRAKIIHMDIKQQNILVDDFLNLKVTDFSVSIDYKNKENIELPLVGTCYYMSPEVLGKKKILVKEASKIDIYSFGVLLYQLAFNDHPYELDKVNSENYSGILNNIKEKDLKFPDDCSHSNMFKNFLKKCLDKNIKNRYNIYEAINDPWIKGYQYIIDEKEKLYSAGKFMIEIMLDNIMPFNDYIKIQKQYNI